MLNTPARCTRKLCKSARESVRNAEWRLSRKIISLDDKPDPEFIDMKRRFWISAALTLPVFILAMAEMLPNFHDNRSAGQVSLWIQFVLATPVVLWGGFPFFERALASVKNVSPNMFTLIAIGTGAAYLFSLVGTVFSTSFFQLRCVMRTPD